MSNAMKKLFRFEIHFLKFLFIRFVKIPILIDNDFNFWECFMNKKISTNRNVLLLCAVFMAAGFVISCASTKKNSDSDAIPANTLQAADELQKNNSVAENISNNTNEDIDAREKTDLDKLKETLQAAREKRDEIIENEFTEYDPENFVKASEAFARAEVSAAKNPKQVPDLSKDDSAFAYLTFSAILDSAWTKKIDAVRKEAAELQRTALKLKADVAVKETYNLAAADFNNGNAAYREREWQKSFDSFVSSKPQFENAAAIAMEKRQLADLALKKAETKIAESEKIAVDAEEFLKNNPQEAEGATL